jgi:hypothetical protein
MNSPKALLTGFFSTVGDMDCLEIVKSWLQEENIEFDVMPYHDDIVDKIPGCVSKKSIIPENYTHLIVICGPCWPGVFSEMGIDLWDYEHCTRVGINLTMMRPLEEWNPFDFLLERDSNHLKRPDLSLLKVTGRVPVIGLCFIESQDEYGDLQDHKKVFRIVDEFLEKHNYASVTLDTRWPKHRNKVGFSSVEQLVSVMGKMDAIITNRLHGMIFSLKSGVPFIALDGIKGGDKVSRQAHALQWPAMESVDMLDIEKLEKWFAWTQSEEAKSAVKSTIQMALIENSALESDFKDIFSSSKKPGKIPANTTPKIEDVKVSKLRKLARYCKGYILKKSAALR